MRRLKMSGISNTKIEKWIEGHGYYFARQKGSHRHFKHKDGGRPTITVPYDVSINVLKIIEKQIGAKYGE